MKILVDILRYLWYTKGKQIEEEVEMMSNTYYKDADGNIVRPTKPVNDYLNDERVKKLLLEKHRKKGKRR